MNQNYIKLTNFFNRNLENFAAKSLHYSEELILILQMNETRLKNEYPDVWENIISCVANMDERSPMEYARDVVSSWIFEDYFVKKVNSLKIPNLKIELSGGDKERKFLNSKKVSSSADTKIYYNGQSCKVEIVNDYTGYWKKTKMLHLRNHKFESLKKEHALLLGVDIVNKKYVLLDVNDENISTVHIDSHKAYGGKEAEQINLSDNDFHKFWVGDIINSVIEKFC